MDLPQLDLLAYTTGNEQSRQEFCQRLRVELQRWGFVSLINYGMPAADIENLFHHSNSFFAMTEAQKMTAPHPPTANPHRGYSFLGQEYTSGLGRPRELNARGGRRLRDLKETFDWGSSDDALYPSVWPDARLERCDIPGFRAALETHFVRAHDLHLTILRALAEGLGAPPHTFLAAHQQNDSEARLAHYPPVPTDDLGEDRGTSRICEHTDSGSVTLLWQDDAGGLEIEDPVTRRFIAVSCPAPAVLVNLGDAMERWTNGLLPAAYHRVGKTSCPGSATGGHVPGRFSIIYFGKPDRKASLAPLAPFVSADQPARYGPVTGEELNQGTLLRTYDGSNTV